MDNPYNILQSILNDPSMFAENDDGAILKEYISDESILAIECNIDFFNDIPKDNLKKVLEDFIEIVFDYDSDLSMYLIDIEVLIRDFVPTKPDSSFNKSGNSTIRHILFKNKKAPSRLKKDDIATLTQYQEMLSRLFPLQARSRKLYINGRHKDIGIIYDINQKLINDLENEDFNIINKNNYYKKLAPTKTKIKQYLSNIQKEYDLRGVSVAKKQLLDELPTADK